MRAPRLAVDEFETIARLFRPLTHGAPEALDLMDDAAAIPSRPGFDLIVTKDALVEGVHFLTDDPPGLVAQKALRVNLSDLAAKGAEPYAYFLAVAWPSGWGDERRGAFAAGLAEDQARFGLVLLGGDTVSTSGPLTLSVTMMGWAPSGGMVRRSGAKTGDVLLVSGTIGDGYLGLLAAQGDLTDLPPSAISALADRYRLSQPRIGLRETLRTHATAALDISDGLLADANHLCSASDCGLKIRLEELPLSPAAKLWLERQPDKRTAMALLAAGGDDYEILCTVTPDRVGEAMAMAKQAGIDLTIIGGVVAGREARVSMNGDLIKPGKMGWVHP